MVGAGRIVLRHVGLKRSAAETRAGFTAAAAAVHQQSAIFCVKTPIAAASGWFGRAQLSVRGSLWRRFLSRLRHIQVVTRLSATARRFIAEPATWFCRLIGNYRPRMAFPSKSGAWPCNRSSIVSFRHLRCDIPCRHRSLRRCGMTRSSLRRNSWKIIKRSCPNVRPRGRSRERVNTPRQGMVKEL